eukprot:gene30281-35269_t
MDGYDRGDTMVLGADSFPLAFRCGGSFLDVDTPTKAQGPGSCSDVAAPACNYFLPQTSSLTMFSPSKSYGDVISATAAFATHSLKNFFATDIGQFLDNENDVTYGQLSPTHLKASPPPNKPKRVLFPRNETPATLPRGNFSQLSLPPIRTSILMSTTPDSSFPHWHNVVETATPYSPHPSATPLLVVNLAMCSHAGSESDLASQYEDPMYVSATPHSRDESATDASGNLNNSAVEGKTKRSSENESIGTNSEHLAESGEDDDVFDEDFNDWERVRPKRRKTTKRVVKAVQEEEHDELMTEHRQMCRSCQTTQTPQWREGPEGVRTLCNACGDCSGCSLSYAVNTVVQVDSKTCRDASSSKNHRSSRLILISGSDINKTIPLSKIQDTGNLQVLKAPGMGYSSQISQRSMLSAKVGTKNVSAVKVVSGQASRPSAPCMIGNTVRAAPAVARRSVVVSAAVKKAVPMEAVIGPNQEKTTSPMSIAFVATECAPWSKTGGLGDVVGGLPIEMVKRGHAVMSISPRYDQYAEAWDTAITANIDGEEVRYFHCKQKGVHRVFVDHPWFLAKVMGKTGSKLYGSKSGADYIDNAQRFALFNKAAIEATRLLPFGTGEDSVFVANDWHSSLVPVLLKDVYQPRGEFTKAKCALTIHNIAFQGRMFPESYESMGLPAESLKRFAFEDGNPKVYTEETPMEESEKPAKPTGKLYPKLNWLKAGILAADKVLTVSPNYATEIASGVEKGVELDKYITQVGGIEGIINGMDTDEWSPSTDKFLTVKYDKTTVFEGKAAAKEVLQAEMGFEVDPDAPLFGYIGRLEEQKGVDIMLEAIPAIIKANPKVQIAVLGTGKATMEKALATLEKTCKGQAMGVVKFSAPLAHLITAGADFLLVPSRFEPCGLIQLHAMQYGTVPVVASTGGLVDTVKEGVTGFHMGALDQDDLLPEDVEAVTATCTRAAEVFETPLYKAMVANCISQDLSWAKPAKKWEAILHELVSGVTSSVKDTVLKPIDVVLKPVDGTQKISPAAKKNTVLKPVEAVSKPVDGAKTASPKSAATAATTAAKAPTPTTTTGVKGAIAAKTPVSA